MLLVLLVLVVIVVMLLLTEADEVSLCVFLLLCVSVCALSVVCDVNVSLQASAHSVACRNPRAKEREQFSPAGEMNLATMACVVLAPSSKSSSCVCV